MSQRPRRLGVRDLLAHPANLLALGFGSGLAPRAPGTVGTLLGVALFLALARLPLGAYLAATAFAVVLGVYACGAASRRLGVHDHPGIVWDEVCGFLVSMIAMPAEPLWIAVGFALFRLFDIVKPWPIRVLDRRVHGGLGIMLDDLVAGLFSLALLQAAYHALG